MNLWRFGHKRKKIIAGVCVLQFVPRGLTLDHVGATTLVRPYSRGSDVLNLIGSDEKVPPYFFYLFVFRFLEHKYSFNIKTYSIYHVK